MIQSSCHFEEAPDHLEKRLQSHRQEVIHSSRHFEEAPDHLEKGPQSSQQAEGIPPLATARRTMPGSGPLGGCGLRIGEAANPGLLAEIVNFGGKFMHQHRQI